jgi:hypothetical protein
LIVSALACAVAFASIPDDGGKGASGGVFAEAGGIRGATDLAIEDGAVRHLWEADLGTCCVIGASAFCGVAFIAALLLGFAIALYTEARDTEGTAVHIGDACADTASDGVIEFASL